MDHARFDLALFDLDHTLIPFDSGLAFTRHLVRAGLLPAGADDSLLASCQRYLAGGIDLPELHAATVGPLGAIDPVDLQRGLADFEHDIAPAVPVAMRELVAVHANEGALCAIVTATSRLIAEPLARIFGVPHLLATETRWSSGRPTAHFDGWPCHGRHKLAQVEAWLQRRPPPGDRLGGFRAAWFYSDSASDLPLLQAVTHPVAVRPDARLRAHAVAQGWRIVDRG